MPRKPKGEVAAKKYSVRLEESIHDKLKARFGGLREALEHLAKRIKVKK